MHRRRKSQELSGLQLTRRRLALHLRLLRQRLRSHVGGEQLRMPFFQPKILRRLVTEEIIRAPHDLFVHRNHLVEIVKVGVLLRRWLSRQPSRRISRGACHRLRHGERLAPRPSGFAEISQPIESPFQRPNDPSRIPRRGGERLAPPPSGFAEISQPIESPFERPNDPIRIARSEVRLPPRHPPAVPAQTHTVSLSTRPAMSVATQPAQADHGAVTETYLLRRSSMSAGSLQILPALFLAAAVLTSPTLSAQDAATPATFGTDSATVPAGNSTIRSEEHTSE